MSASCMPTWRARSTHRTIMATSASLLLGGSELLCRNVPFDVEVRDIGWPHAVCKVVWEANRVQRYRSPVFLSMMHICLQQAKLPHKIWLYPLRHVTGCWKAVMHTKTITALYGAKFSRLATNLDWLCPFGRKVMYRSHPGGWPRLGRVCARVPWYTMTVAVSIVWWQTQEWYTRVM